MHLQLKLFQIYHNKQSLIEKRDLAKQQREELMKIEKVKQVSDEEIKAKKRDLAISNKELAGDEQKIKEMVKNPNLNQREDNFGVFLSSGSVNQQKSADLHKS